MELKFGALVFAGAGLLFLVIGVLIITFFRKRRQQATMVATAKVVDVERRRNSDGGSCYYPVFEYYAGGLMRRVVSTYGTNPCRYQLGEEVELFYNPEKPEKFWSERDTKMMRFLCGIFVGIGGVFMILGVCLWRAGAL